MKFNPLAHIRYHIYLLQLENYFIGRFLSVASRSIGSVPRTLRLGIVWTHKMRVVVALSVFLHLITSRLLSSFPTLFGLSVGVSTVIVFLLLSYISFVFLSFATILVWPIDYFLKRRIIKKAKVKRDSLENLRVIGITGSYGKTTMKEVVSAVLETSLNVVKTEENKNTPLGVSKQMINSLNPNTDVFVVEMGAYKRGDIKELVELVSPDIVILTGINEAHLERQGCIENTIKTKFEIVDNAAKGSTVILNADDKRIVEHYSKYVRDDQNVYWYSSRSDMKSPLSVGEVIYSKEGISFSLSRNEESLGSFKMKFLPRYIVGNAIASIIVADEFSIRMSAVKTALSEITPPPHRLSLTSLGDMSVIDDSYNGTPDGVREAISVLSRFNEGRKIYITPGLVEMGGESEGVHIEIGELLAPVADLVILIRNSVSPYIKKGLLSSGFKEENILIYPSAIDAHSALRLLVKPKDTVLFQNDWPENYL